MTSKQILALALSFLFVIPSFGQHAKLRILHSFGSAGDGAHPSGGLLSGDGGSLYGVTAGGPGEYGSGIAFKLTSQKNGKWSEAVLHVFAANDGSPWGSFVTDKSKNLYGTTLGGPASNSDVYEIAPRMGGWHLTVLYTDGAGPGLVSDHSGNLFGAIGVGGDHGIGALGELSPGDNGWNYTDLFDLNPEVGYAPPAPPIWDGKGNMFGVTTDGGIGKPACFNYAGCGVFYEMTPNGDGTWTYHILHRFASSPDDGQWPYGGLVMDSAGDFYGSTWLGGKYGHGNGQYGHGTIFKFSLSGGKWKETVLWSFPNCLQGCMAMGTLAMDKSGSLYGTAAGGSGSCGGEACGVVFKLAPQKNGKWKYTVLHDFTSADGGVQPFYGVILDGHGHLFGVTSGFGKYGGGTAFEIVP